MIDAECKREPGNPTDERGENGRYEPIVDNVNNWDNRPVGNSLDAGLRRLRKEVERKTPKAKELQAKVFAQEVSVNAALIELGIRKKTVTIPVEVARAARAIKRHFTDEQVRELKDLL